MTVIDSVLGQGIDFPIIYNRGKIKDVHGVESVVAAIWMLFGTPKNVRFFEPAYGSNLQSLVFEPCSAITGQIATIFAKDAILEWIPRVKDVDVEYVIFNEESLILLEITFQLQNSATEVMMTYPFYVQSNDFIERKREVSYTILNQ